MSKRLTAAESISTIASTPVLEDLVIEHGPITSLGRFFLLADSAMAEAGVTMVRTTLAEAAATQAANGDSWAMFPPMLDTRLSKIPEDTSYGLLGLDATGNVVCAQGGRIYDTGDRSLADLVGDQSFFYGTEIPPRHDMPWGQITAPSAPLVRGRFVYSGALWVHPAFRGKGLAGILPRFSRCYALAKWDTAFTVGIINEQALVPKLLQAYGYKRIEPRLTIHNFAPNPVHAVVLLMDRTELEADLTRFIEVNAPKIDGAVGDGGAQDEPRTVTNSNR